MARSKQLKTIRGSLDRAVRIARDAGRITAAGEVDVLLASRLATIADKVEDQEFVRAVSQLRAVMDRLPLEEPVAPVGPVGSGDGGGERGRVLQLLDGPPTVGDSANA